MALAIPGTREKTKSYLTDGAISERYLICEIGSDADHIAVTNSLSDIALGIVEDEAAGAEERVSVTLLGLQTRSVLIRAGEVIAAGNMLIPNVIGRCLALPTDPGTYYILARALSSGNTGELVEAVTFFPIQRVVT